MRDGLRHRGPYIAAFIEGDGSMGIRILNDRNRVTDGAIPRLRPHVIMYQKISGYMDSEGCLNFHISKTPAKVGICYYIRPRAIIGMKLPESYSNYFNVINRFLYKEGIKGYVNIQKSGMSVITIEGDKNVRKFILVISPYLTIKKEQADIMLKIISFLKMKRGKMTQEDFIKAMEMIDKLNSLKSSGRGKTLKNGYSRYNANYFRRMWGLDEKTLPLTVEKGV